MTSLVSAGVYKMNWIILSLYHDAKLLTAGQPTSFKNIEA